MELASAVYYIKRMYQRTTKKKCLTLYIDGDITFPMSDLWLTSRDHDVFCKIVYRATKKYPDSVPRLAQGVLDVIVPTTYMGCWLNGYLTRVLEEEEWLDAILESSFEDKLTGDKT